MEPVIQCAGEKTRLLHEIRKLYPETVERYCEPFVGGGTVLLDVISLFSPREILINDINPRITNLYEQIRDNPEKLVKLLRGFEKEYANADDEYRRRLCIRNKIAYNCNKNTRTPEEAALLIFLNKTGNVQTDKCKKPCICDENNIHAVNQALQNAEIRSGSYIDCLDWIDKDAFVYLDPPYRPLSKTAALACNKHTFGDKEQIQLAEFVSRLNKKGAGFVLSNSDPHNTNADDDFLDELYSSFNIKRVTSARTSTRPQKAEEKISELLIYNKKRK